MPESLRKLFHRSENHFPANEKVTVWEVWTWEQKMRTDARDHYPMWAHWVFYICAIWRFPPWFLMSSPHALTDNQLHHWKFVFQKHPWYERPEKWGTRNPTPLFPLANKLRPRQVTTSINNHPPAPVFNSTNKAHQGSLQEVACPFPLLHYWLALLRPHGSIHMHWQHGFQVENQCEQPHTIPVNYCLLGLNLKCILQPHYQTQ